MGNAAALFSECGSTPSERTPQQGAAVSFSPASLPKLSSVFLGRQRDMVSLAAYTPGDIPETSTERVGRKAELSGVFRLASGIAQFLGPTE